MFWFESRIVGAVVACLVGLQLGRTVVARARASSMRAVAAKRRAKRDADLAAARAKLPPRPAPDREDAVAALAAFELAAAIRAARGGRAASGRASVTSLEAVTIYCHRAL
jgi:hypothetical protein